MGTKKGYELLKKYHRKCKVKYGEYYILKCDISKFFASISQVRLKEKLKIKYYVRYQDDFLLFHESKQYLKYCLEEIKQFLKKEGLELNRKSRLYKSTNNFIFLGRNKYGKYAKYRTVKRKLKKKKYLYYSGIIKLSNLTSSQLSFSHIEELKIKKHQN